MYGKQNVLLKYSKILQWSNEFNLVDILKTTDFFSKKMINNNNCIIQIN